MLLGFPLSIYPPSFLDLPRILGATTGAHLYKRAETVLSMGVKMGAREREQTHRFVCEVWATNVYKQGSSN